MEFYILAFIGALLHFLFKWNNARKRKVNFNLSGQAITSLIGIISVFLIIYSADDFKATFELNKISAVALGYLGDSTFKNLVKSFQKKITV